MAKHARRRSCPPSSSNSVDKPTAVFAVIEMSMRFGVLRFQDRQTHFSIVFYDSIGLEYTTAGSFIRVRALRTTGKHKFTLLTDV